MQMKKTNIIGQTKVARLLCDGLCLRGVRLNSTLVNLIENSAMVEQNTELFIGLVALYAAKALALEFLSRRHRREWFEVGRLDALSLFPLKSARGIDLEEAQCEYGGLQISTQSGTTVKDRSFIVVTSNLEMVTGRQKPKLLSISCSILNEGLQLKAPDMEELIIPWKSKEPNIQAKTCVWGDEVEGVDCGGKASEWLNHFLGTNGYRILQNTEESSKRNLSLKSEKWYQYARDVDEVTYQDGFPFMLVASSSIADINTRMKEKHGTEFKPVSREIFRATFFVKTDNPPFGEDNWAEIRIGECHFFNIKPCDRCFMTIIDPVEVERRRDMEPLKTLRNFRLLDPEFGESPCFGINLTLIKPGRVNKGDKVFVRRSSPFVTTFEQFKVDK